MSAVFARPGAECEVVLAASSDLIRFHIVDNR